MFVGPNRFLQMALALPVVCGLGAAQDGLQLELQRRGVEEGLTIADLQNAPPRLTLIRFGEYYPVFAHYPNDFLIARFSPSGRAVVGEQMDGRLRVTDLAGTETASLDGRVLGSLKLALSKDAKRVAFCGVYTATDPRKVASPRLPGIHLADLQSQKIVLVRAFADEDERWNCGEMSLSPDGQQLAYDWKGEIFIYDSLAKLSRLLVRGRLSSWSPDGQWIAYVDDSQSLRMISPSGAPNRLLLEGPKICGGLRWSPDGKYLAFGEDELRPPYVASHLVVLRLSDGSAVSVRDSGYPGIGRDQGWIFFDMSRTVER
jgi:Tol biopolymer transport system component